MYVTNFLRVASIAVAYLFGPQFCQVPRTQLSKHETALLNPKPLLTCGVQGSAAYGALITTRFPSSTLLPFFWGVPLLKPNSRKKGTLIIKGPLGNLDKTQDPVRAFTK